MALNLTVVRFFSLFSLSRKYEFGVLEIRASSISIFSFSTLHIRGLLLDSLFVIFYEFKEEVSGGGVDDGGWF